MIRLDRRGLLAGIGASFLAGAARGGEGAVYVGARLDTGGAASVAAFDLDGRELFATALPGRGHDMAVHPSGDEFVVLARRPGRFAAVLASAGGAVRQMILARPDRHFFGHGTYAPDGRLFYTTENALEDEAGRIGVHDVAAGYRRIGEFTSGGVGPHDIARFRRGGRVVLAVANGGIRTHPDTGRDMLNVETMRANLAFIDAATGDLMERIELPADMRLSSLRHIDVNAAGVVAFGCQWAGEKVETPPLVGVVENGRARLFDMQEPDLARLDAYIGSVAFDARGEVIVATAPNGGALALFAPGRGYLGQRRITDVCGAAALPAASGAGLFLVSSGNAGVRIVAVDADRPLPEPLRRQAWDNHLRRLDAPTSL